MSNNYCDVCNNINVMSTDNDKLTFVCTQCGNNKEGTAEDTLIQSTIKLNTTDKYRNLIRHGGKDCINPLVFRDCEKCKSNMFRVIRLEETQEKIYLCIKCDNYIK